MSDDATETTVPGRPCSKCGARPRRPRQRWCGACHLNYKRGKRATAGEETAAPDTEPVPEAPAATASMAMAPALTLTERIVRFLDERDRITTTADLAAAVGEPETLVRVTLLRLAREGRVNHHPARPF